MKKIIQNSEIRVDKNDRKVTRIKSPLIVPMTIFEILLVIVLLILNYFLRFDPSTRYNADMTNLWRILINCDEQHLNSLSRPYYNYSMDDDKSLEGLELNYQLSELVFFLFVFLIPIPIFSLVESLKATLFQVNRREIEAYGRIIPELPIRISQVICGYLAGWCITGLIICIIKFNIVSPRPHFMNVCFVNDLQITPPSCLRNPYWNPEENCDNPDKRDILESLKSFPSYHAGVATFCGMFTLVYLRRATKKFSHYSIPQLLVFLVLMTLALIGGTHRLSAGYSFPIDIIIGSLIGLVLSLYVAKITSKSYLLSWVISNQNVDNENSLEKQKELSIKELYENKLTPVSSKSSLSSSDSNDSDTGMQSVESEDYEKNANNIGVYSFIPRVTAPQKAKPAEAINSNIGVVQGISRESPNPSNIGLMPISIKPTSTFVSTSAPMVDRTNSSTSSSNSSSAYVYNTQKQRSSKMPPPIYSGNLSNKIYNTGNGVVKIIKPMPNHGYVNKTLDSESEF